MTKRKKLFNDYTADELMHKIEYEGGMTEFFLHYESAKSFAGTPIEDEVLALEEAYQALIDKLADHGIAA